ncbi:MAG TPA: hypothetical protein VN694_11170 [Caulobacteraceae bacterium]|nr:hypothetical protein [Caulobacteraceae bacterium]
MTAADPPPVDVATPARWRRQRRRAEAETRRGERAMTRPRLTDEHLGPTH